MSGHPVGGGVVDVAQQGFEFLPHFPGEIGFLLSRWKGGGQPGKVEIVPSEKIQQDACCNCQNGLKNFPGLLADEGQQQKYAGGKTACQASDKKKATQNFPWRIEFSGHDFC